MNAVATPAEKSRILLVEDTQSLATLYCGILEAAGFSVDHVTTGNAAIAAVDTGAYRVMLLDLQLPDMGGFEVMEQLGERRRGVTTVVVTGQGSIATAVDAMRRGAYDFLVKPVAEERLATTVRNAQERAELQQTVKDLAPDIGADGYFGFIGRSMVMRSVYRMIDSVARSRATVFITGESGTGKEVCAEAIHKAGPRRAAPFVVINCAAIPKDLIESEIFGHVKGAFTGATSDRKGAAAQANGGTLFLDEICEMETALQAKLLRFLQSSRIQPVGSATLEEVDVRVICATNRNPSEEVAAGRFREDLFYRLHVLPIHLPPLREREGDVMDIANRFLHQYVQEEGKRFRTFAADAQALLLGHHWPGNVRELQNVVRNAVVLHDGEVVTGEMLAVQLFAGGSGDAVSAGEGPAPVELADRRASARAEEAPQPVGAEAEVVLSIGQSLAEMERRFIEATIDHCDGSLPRAARMLEVSPSTLYRKRESWDLAG